MTKSDDVIKSKLKEYLITNPPLKKRVYIGTGSEKFDQKTWEEGGLTFYYNDITYGSNDFAIYTEENWTTPTNSVCNEKPFIVIEATDALNRGSSGDAQVQRLHHLYPTVRQGIPSIYYLEPGKHDLYGQMIGSAYFFSRYYQKLNNNNNSVLLITKNISHIQELIDNFNNSDGLNAVIEKILNLMLKYFTNYFRNKYKSSWNIFFEKTHFNRTKDNDYFFISAIRPPYPETNKPPWSDSHHRAASLPLMGRFLVMGCNTYDVNKSRFYFILPLFRLEALIEMNRTKINDKEWKIFSGVYHGWDIVTLDEIDGLDNSDYNISRDIWGHNLNKNPYRRMWGDFIEKITRGLKNGTLAIKLNKYKFNTG